MLYMQFQSTFKKLLKKSPVIRKELLRHKTQLINIISSLSTLMSCTFVKIKENFTYSSTWRLMLTAQARVSVTFFTCYQVI
jgi:predicted transposase YdaD